MLIPEIIIEETLRIAFKFIRDDFEASPTEQESFLYSMFKNQGHKLALANFDYYEQAKSIFLRDSKNPRKLEIYLGYNLSRAAFPTIHIIMPAEEPGQASIGDDLGIDGGVAYLENEVEDFEGGELPAGTLDFRRRLEQLMSTRYNLLITSSNSMEVVLIYNVLKYIMLVLRYHLELKGFHNVKIGGSDISFTEDMMPNTIFHRNLTLGFDYQFQVVSSNKEAALLQLAIEGTPVI